jgi:signal transduction histidine kinase
LGERGERAARGYRRAGGLTGRTVAVIVLLAVTIGTAYTLLVLAIDGLRDADRRANHSLAVLAATNGLERLVIDIESTQRGFIIAGEPAFLVPWNQARDSFREQADALEDLAEAEDAGQGQQVGQLTRATDDYIREYAIPLVALAQRDLDSARTAAVTTEGKGRVDDLRERFEAFRELERRSIRMHQDQADSAARRATVAAAISVAGSIGLIVFSGGYLVRSVVRPVRRASAMAGRVAGGNLAVRMPESGPGEVGVLARAFNKMAGSLQSNSGELRRIADEQAALRRVATLVARGVVPDQVFGAVAAETGQVLGADCMMVGQFGTEGTVTVIGGWARPGAAGLMPPVGSRWPTGEDSVAGRVLRTGGPVRTGERPASTGPAAAWAAEHGIRSSVGSPIVVEGRLWGTVLAFSSEPGAHPPGTEHRLLAFTELVGMAVANSDSRAQLAASRARVVAAADETRRRIERDLHDGIQQRLISLALELRVAAAQVPPDAARVGQQWTRSAQDLTEVVEELREISRGLHPAILERGGLDPAVRALARRAAVPVDLHSEVRGRLPEPVEVAAYYVVSEALTNAAKHAQASVVGIDISQPGDTLRLLIRDDGAGGADPARGSGLIGLSDRVAAAGGRIEITSPPGGGTSLLVTIPVQDSR